LTISHYILVDTSPSSPNEDFSLNIELPKGSDIYQTHNSSIYEGSKSDELYVIRAPLSLVIEDTRNIGKNNDPYNPDTDYFISSIYRIENGHYIDISKIKHSDVNLSDCRDMSIYSTNEENILFKTLFDRKYQFIINYNNDYELMSCSDEKMENCSLAFYHKNYFIKAKYNDHIECKVGEMIYGIENLIDKSSR
jgi:endo-1,4-beta-mannosidase